MTISSTTNRVSFAGNGVTVAFATSPVVFFDAADLTVYDVVTATGVSTLKTLTTDYTVTGGSGATGTVTMLVAPATGHTLLIVRDVAITQGSDLVNNDASDAEVIEDAFDRLTMITQQLDARVDRAFRLADSDVTGVDVELPDATARALTTMGFDANGDFTLYDPLSAVTDDANVAVLRSATGAVTTTLHSFIEAQQFNVKADFGAVGDGVTDDTAAFIKGMGKKLYVPAGTYIVTNLAILSNTELFGDGWLSIIKQKASAGSGEFVLAVNRSDGGTSSVSGNKKNIYVHDLLIQGRVAAESFSQFCHLFHASAVSDLLIERVKFSGFKGDGLYIGSGDSGTVERHNERVTVRDCYFDGENNDNRNGVSVIDCSGMLIENNYFVNCTRTNMPGAIDIEPDTNVYHIVKNIEIAKNRFANNGGTNGSISIFIPNAVWTTQPTGFKIVENVIAGNSTDHGIFVQHAGNTTSSRDHDVKITRNTVSLTKDGLRLFGLTNVTVEDNTFDETTAGPLIGYTVVGAAQCDRVNVSNNYFKKIGSDNSLGGSGIQIFTVNYLTFMNNVFIDCGKTNGTIGYALDFNEGTSSYVALINNRILNPGTRTTFAIQKEAAHTFTPATNRMYGIELISCTSNAFQAEDSDQYETSYTPVVEGATTAGTPTYNSQYGRYMRRGKLVTFWASVDISAPNTSAGLIELSIPLAAKSQTPLFSISVLSATGLAASSQTFVGRLNTGASAGGITGAIRMYRSDGNALTQVTIPAGAFTLEVAGSYVAT